MKIKVKYFAAMREASGVNEEVINSNAINPLELYKELKEKYPLFLDEKHLKVALNEQYVSFSHPLDDLDTVVFIPPVAGG